MADASLDDFFAKKDKSKKKNKSKFTASDILAKKDEEPKPEKPPTEKKKKEKVTEQQGDVKEETEGKQDNKVQDEEWIDYEKEEETDYSGLRIQTLQISREEEEREDKNEEEDEVDEDGEIIERKDGSQGPWAKGQGVTPVPKPAPVVAAPEPKVEEPTPTTKTTGKYVPPGARAAAANPTALPLSRRKPKTAPNIKSEEDFPTLGGGSDKEREAAQTYMMSGSKFEKVRSGGRQTEDATSKGPQLTLGNKFEALRRE